jgi:hypothetical protein
MDFLLTGGDIRRDRIFCIRDVRRSFIAPTDRVAELLRVVLKSFRCSLDSTASGFGRVA